MRRRSNLRRLVRITMGIWAGVAATGCHQHHYYLNPQQTSGVVSDPGTTLAYGDVCAVPQGTVVQSGVPIVTSNLPAAGPVVVAGAPGSTRTVISEPKGNLFSGKSMRAWRATDPESRVTLRTEGAYNEEMTVR